MDVGTSLGTAAESETGENDKLQVIFIVLFGAGATVTLVALIASLRHFRLSRRRENDLFNEAVRQAQKHVTGSPLLQETYARSPTSGTYQAQSYNPKRRRRFVWSANLKFTGVNTKYDVTVSIQDDDEEASSDKKLQYWNIPGEGQNVDGTFTILHGCVAPNGEAYWVERGSAMDCLVNGSFDFQYDRMFGGRWRSNRSTTALFDPFGRISGQETKK